MDLCSTREYKICISGAINGKLYIIYFTSNNNYINPTYNLQSNKEGGCIFIWCGHIENASGVLDKWILNYRQFRFLSMDIYFANNNVTDRLNAECIIYLDKEIQSRDRE